MDVSLESTIRPGFPDFQDLPWDRPLTEWKGYCVRVEEAPRGLSRHPVVFVNYNATLYAIKELPADVAQKEYQNLLEIEDLRLPTVTPVGYIKLPRPPGSVSFLVTRYLEYSQPYRLLFMRSELDRYREHLLDAMAGLLVQLHLAGVFWGDCSLSNTLFRRDAGTLQAYLVDAETSEVHLPRLSPALRHDELMIMEENVTADLEGLDAAGLLNTNFSIIETGAYIRLRYQELWDAVTREVIIAPEERYRIQEHIRSLNGLGFSVSDVEIRPSQQGDKLRLRISVTDRNFHRDQLLALTGLEAEEMQARQMMNEIYELRATLSQQNYQDTPINVAAYHWLEQIYQPTIGCLQPLLQHRAGWEEPPPSPAELYCQILEHKWYLSERAQHDVGHQAAAEDYLHNIAHYPPAA